MRCRRRLFQRQLSYILRFAQEVCMPTQKYETPGYAREGGPQTEHTLG